MDAVNLQQWRHWRRYVKHIKKNIRWFIISYTATADAVYEMMNKGQEKTCKQYNFYSLDRASAVVSLNDDYDEEPEPNFDEEADDED